MTKIFINPGHFPSADPGCVNKAFGVYEADYVKEIGQLVYTELIERGYKVKMLQSDNLRNAYDDDLSQPCVVDEANEWGADIAISIHCNAFNGIAKGTECICFQRGSRAECLASCIQDKLVCAINTVDRGVKYEEDKPKDERLSFCMKTSMPAVVVECAFLDNYDDALILLNYKQEIADAICDGIEVYCE